MSRSRVGRVVRNSAVLAVSKILERASGFVVGVLIANQLGIDALGIYAAAWALYGVIAVAGVAGTTDYLVREISRDPSRTAAYTVHLSVIALVFSGAIMLVTQIVVRQLGYSADLEASVSVMLLAILPKVVNGIQEGVFVAYGRVAYQTLTRFWSAMGYVALSAWLLARGAEVPALVWTFVAMEYGVAVVYFVLINRNIVRLRPRFRWSLARRLVRELKAFTASSLIAALFARPEVVILSLMVSEREIGLYSAALRVIELPLTLVEVFMVNVFPMMSDSYRVAEERFAAWQTAAVRVILACSLLFAACCLALAEPILRLLYGEEFDDAATVMRVLGVNVVFFSLISVFWRSLVSRGRQAVNLQLQTLSVGLRLASGVGLIGPLAALGAAISSGASSLAHVLMLVRATARAGAPSNVVALGWRFALAAAGTSAAMWLVADRLPLAAALAAGCALYAVLALALRAVTPEDRLLIRRLGAARRGRGKQPA
jgi:O-antigen/teichoic acid export membrane protein